MSLALYLAHNGTITGVHDLLIPALAVGGGSAGALATLKAKAKRDKPSDPPPVRR